MVLRETPIQSTTAALPGDGRSLLISQQRVACQSLQKGATGVPWGPSDQGTPRLSQRENHLPACFSRIPEDREWCAFPCGGAYPCSRGCKSPGGSGWRGGTLEWVEKIFQLTQDIQGCERGGPKWITKRLAAVELEEERQENLIGNSNEKL